MRGVLAEAEAAHESVIVAPCLHLAHAVLGMAALAEPSHEACVANLRNALGEADFDALWAAGADLSTEEAIAYAQRGRGERKRFACIGQ